MPHMPARKRLPRCLSTLCIADTEELGTACLQVIYSFPSAAQEASGLPADLADSLAGFCFPAGVRPELLERTPSMSALNEVIYSQPYQTHDDQSFVFLMKVGHGPCDVSAG